MKALDTKPAGIPTRRSGFTLIELLTVFFIIALLAGLVLTATGRIKKSARNQQALAITNSLQLAVREYHAEYGEWPFPEKGGTWSNDNNLIIDTYLTSDAPSNFHRRTFWEVRGVVTNPATKQPFVIEINVTNGTVSVQ